METKVNSFTKIFDNKYIAHKAVLSIASLLAIAAGNNAVADEYGENVIYLGGGTSTNDSGPKNSSTPSSVGYMRVPNNGSTVWGVDVGGEGTKIDNTWGNITSKQSTSLNLLVGKNISQDENLRFDAAIIMGVREKTSNCPKSYLGYQCYADSKPETSNELNLGAVLAITYKRVFFGFRATNASTQTILGLHF